MDYINEAYKKSLLKRLLPPITGILILGTLFVTLLFFIKDRHPAPKPKPSLASQNDALTTTYYWQTLTLARGDTLTKLVDELGLTEQQIAEINQDPQIASVFKAMKPGQLMHVMQDQQHRFRKLVYPFNEQEILVVQLAQSHLHAYIKQRTLEQHLAYTEGSIDTSLYIDAARVGLPSKLIMQLATIFGWDVDFVHDLKVGDHFNVLYEVYYDGNTISHYGNIVAAEFTNHDKTYYAVRYTDDKNTTSYYTPAGINMKGAFIRTPVDYTRISSRFTTKRWHPVLHQFRHHTGVDYAADYGTPIKATADGRVVFIGVKGGYGNTIIIKHGLKYSTLYAHMSRFNKKLRWGSYIKQNQVIGYVGQSGLATGPHLHYEFQVYGKHRDPLTVTLPRSAPITKAQQSRFLAHTHNILAKLALFSDNQYAHATSKQ